MKITKERAITNFIDLKKSNPRKFNEIRQQFISMSLGEDGGPLYSSDRSISVRDHYYPTWSDEDFLEVLSEINKLS